MFKVNSFLSMLFISLNTIVVSQVNFQSITFDEALKKAQVEGKLVFVDVYTTWCGPCKRMDNQVFTNSEVGKRLNRDYISLKIDNEKSEDRTKIIPYNVKGYPTMLVLDPTGKELSRVYGFHDVNELLKALDQFLPSNEQPLNIAKAELDKNQDSKDVWQRTIMYFYKEDFSLYREYGVKYYEKFGLTSIDNEFDKGIFHLITLPLGHPIVQSILRDGFDGDDVWSYEKYKTLSLQSRVKMAKTTQEIESLKIEASDLYDVLIEKFFGDFAAKEYYMDAIFGGATESKLDDEQQVPVDDSSKQSTGATGAKNKKKLKK